MAMTNKYDRKEEDNSRPRAGAKMPGRPRFMPGPQMPSKPRPTLRPQMPSKDDARGKAIMKRINK